ncbi:MAG: glycosyltransferase family 1 protein [Bacteroidia bacterium]|nr:glycosyltransferase family 1 protein [Bacteroidia bacterium]
MNYRFVRLTNYYPQVIDWFYKTNPAAASASYNRQYQNISANVLDQVSAYIHELNNFGYEATEIISNAKDLQLAWLIENRFTPTLPVNETVLNQLKKLKPDILWIDDLSLAEPYFISAIRSSIPELKLLITHLCAPYNKSIETKLKFFDLVITCTPAFANELKSLGLNSTLIYHGFDSRILDFLKPVPAQQHAIVFSGSLYTGSAYHQGRIRFLEKMINAGLDLEIFANTESRLKFTARKIYELLKHDFGRSLNTKYYSRNLKQKIKAPVFGKEMYTLLGNSKICFNMHGEVAGNSAGNIRLFEATGMGTCLVTDYKDNIHELFEPEKEIVTYRSAEECIDKIKWLLNHPDDMEKIAKAGQQRTLRDHTIAKRAAQLNEIISRHLK